MMIRAIFVLGMLLSTLTAPDFPAESRTVFAMKTGVLLRMHVVAQDDTAEMQHLKLCVRDAVQQAYADAPDSNGPMLTRANALLPLLTQAARDAAAAEGFTGSVAVSIENLHFGERALDGLTIPAGMYPALMIRLGDAQGRNWWGLIDPQLALECSAIEDHPLQWDWSLLGFLKSLLGMDWMVTAHE